jgi:RNA polymerase sigma-70 factor (ECF subfamily)
MVMDDQGVEVAQLREKDPVAFRSLFERLQQPITGYLHRLVGDSDVALDLTQDTFLQVYKEIDKTSSDIALNAWIYRIATNYGLQYLRRKKLKQFISLFSMGPAHDDEMERHSEHSNEGGAFHLSAEGPSVEEEAETRILIKQAFSLLKQKDAVCVQLHYGTGFTYEQIAEIVEITPEAVRKRVSRGVEKFREVYGKVPAVASVEQMAEKRLRVSRQK